MDTSAPSAGQGIFSNRFAVRRIYRKVLVLFLLSALLAALCISVANDMYAFVKPDREEILTVSEPMNIQALSLLLEEKGILRNPHVFILYARSKDKTEFLENFSGTVTLNTAMSYREIVQSFSGIKKS